MNIQDLRRSNLAKWVAEHGVPQAERSYFSQLLSHTASFGERSARRLEHDYKMGEGYLDTPERKRVRAKAAQTGASPAPDEFIIPQFSGHGIGGKGRLMLQDQPGQIYGWRVNTEWLARNLKTHTGVQNLCIVTGFGDSMRPMYNPGDPLIMDKGVTAFDFDGVYFFRIEEEGYLKRLQRIPGKGLVAISQNKKYRDWTIKPGMDFEVLGRVIKAWCGEDF